MTFGTVSILLRNQVVTVTAVLAEKLAHRPDYAAVFIPSIFGLEIEVAAEQAVFPNGEDQDGIVSSSPSLQSACFAFGFLDGKDIGRTPEECHDEGPETMILGLEYEKGYLHAGILEIYWEYGLFPINSKATYFECGEQDRERIGERAYTLRVQKFLDDFMSKAFHNYPRHNRDDVRAIVLAGEASLPAFAILGDIALSTVGTQLGKIATGIHPPYTVAHSAAAYARKAQEYKRTGTHGGVIACTLIQDDEYYAEKKRLGIKEEYEL